MILHYGVSHALPPTTLPDILKLLVHDIIGYKIDDTYVTAAGVRTSWLLQGASGSKLPRVISDEKRQSKLSLLLCSKVTEEDYKETVQAQYALFSPWSGATVRAPKKPRWTKLWFRRFVLPVSRCHLEQRCLSP